MVMVPLAERLAETTQLSYSVSKSDVPVTSRTRDMLELLADLNRGVLRSVFRGENSSLEKRIRLEEHRLVKQYQIHNYSIY